MPATGGRTTLEHRRVGHRAGELGRAAGARVEGVDEVLARGQDRGGAGQTRARRTEGDSASPHTLAASADVNSRCLDMFEAAARRRSVARQSDGCVCSRRRNCRVEAW